MKAMILLSGGVDSTTCLAVAIERFGAAQVGTLAIRYGQKHERELAASEQVAAHYGVAHEVLDLTSVFADSDCSLLAHSDAEIPRESYAEQLAQTDGAPVSTYVPFRNGLFLSAAASVALAKGCEVLYYGAHRDDAAGNAYPDCSADFVHAMDASIRLGSGEQLRLEAPFIACTKAEVVREGLRLGAPYELTWSCYEGGERPCGTCGTCRDRAAAFAANHVPDPALR